MTLGCKGLTIIEEGKKSNKTFAMPTQAFVVFNFESNSVKAIVAPSYGTLKYYNFFCVALAGISGKSVHLTLNNGCSETSSFEFFYYSHGLVLVLQLLLLK